jgi:lipopolysaccharide/colanic/teichoic acid biosynthesis glycosyltransferase
MELDPTVRRELIRQIGGNIKPSHLFRGKMKVAAWEITIRFSYFAKRLLDIVVSLLALIALLPVFMITALSIVLENPGPVFFVQIRVGRNGHHFRFYKFRSMVLNAEKLKSELAAQNESKDGVIFKMKNDPRITRTGRIIRKFSIDELPQLINVLKGDMSLVGPRPPVPKEVAEYTLEQRKRLHAIPGITGLWQVSGRSDIPFTDQVRLDLQYIQSAGVINDLHLLLKTIPAVLSGKGAY